MRPWPEDRLAFGGDYNPEQWPRETWPEDIELMREAGVTFVTLGVFSWSWLEPAKGEYDFGWLDEVDGPAARQRHRRRPGHRDRHPAALAVPRLPARSCPSTATATRCGRAAGRPGAPARRALPRARPRPHRPSSRTRYHDHPALAMWHVSNEYACHNLPCYCDTCAAAFRRWLRAPLRPPRRPQRRLGHRVLEPALHRLGAGPAAAAHDDVRQPDPPAGLPPVQLRHPARLLPRREGGPDRALPRRPGDDELHDADPLPAPRLPPVGARARTSSAPTTTSSTASTHPRAELAFSGDLTRGPRRRRPVDADGALDAARSTGSRSTPPRRPARRSATASPTSPAAPTRIGFFQWRQSQAGLGEVPLGAGAPRRPRTAARFREVCELGEIAAAARRGARQSRWRPRSPCSGTTRPPGPSPARAMPSLGSTTRSSPQTVHRLLRDRGVTVDVVHPGADLDAYRLVVVPTLYLVTDEHAAAIARGRRGRRAGAGHLLLRDQRRATTTCGSAATPGRSATCSASGSRSSSRSLSGETVRPVRRRRGDAVDRGRHGDRRRQVADDLRGRVRSPGAPPSPDATVGSGSAWYLGTLPDDASLAALLDRIVPRLPGCGPACRRCPAGVEVVRRRGTDGSWLFLAQRHRRRAARSTSTGHDLVTGPRRRSTLRPALPAGSPWCGRVRPCWPASARADPRPGRGVRGGARLRPRRRSWASPT